MKKLLLSCFALCAFAAFAAGPTPLLVPDFNRDGKIDVADYDRLAAGEAFTVWLNDDDDAAGAEADDGKGDTNNDLHDVPGGNDKRDCADDHVNGRCDLLDFFPVLIDLNGVEGSGDYTWKLISKSVNVVFTQLQTGNAGDFHTKEAKALDGETPLYRADVEKLADGDDGKEEVSLPDGFLKNGLGVILIEGAALRDEGLTLRGEKNGSDPVEVTLKLSVKNVEDMYGWMNLREKVKDEGEGEQWTVDNSSVRLRLPTSTSSPSTSTDSRHFILVHGYNTNPDEARGNAAEFYKKLYQSGSDAMFTAVEWRGDQSQTEFFGHAVTPNYHVNVENAFLAARPFADACKKLPGEKILVAHSLGNVLVSSAIRDYGLDYTKYVMLNAAVPREAYDANAYDEDMVPEDWLGNEVKVEGEGEGGNSLTNHLDRAARWYRNFADHKYDPYEYRRKLAWRGRFANLPRTVNYYSQSDNILVNPAPNEPDPDEVFKRDDPDIYGKVEELLVAKLVNGRSIGSGGSKKTGFGFWSFSEKLKGTWLLDTVNDVLTNLLEVAQADAYKREGGWGENENYVEGLPFDPANTRFTPFLDERLKTQGMLDILPAETERVRAQHLADAIPAESFAAGANEVATVENVNEESFIGWNPDWPLYEGEEGEGTRTNLWNHSAFREVAFYHTSKFYASLAAVGKPRVIIDTDLGSSMDDLFTVDLAARMHKAGKLDLMAVMMDRPDKFNPEKDGEFLTFADRYLASLGLGDLPIGKAMMPADSQTSQYVFNPYWTLIYSNNLTGVGLLLPTNRTPDQIESLTNAVALYRRLLHDLPGGQKVVICSTGFLTNLKGLMESEENEGGDDIWSTGLELIEQKVKELRIMGGWFDLTTEPADGAHGAEYNFAGDPAAAKKVVEGWPTPVILSPWEVGLKLDYKTPNVLEDFPPGTFDPVVRAAHIYWPEPLGDDDKNRLWDPATVLSLTEGEAFLPLSEMGGVSVDDYGKTTFVPDPSSNRCYQVASKMNATAVMNRIRAICRTDNPSLPDAVRCIKDAGVDYNGHDLTFKVPKFSLGTYNSNDVHMVFAFDDESYVPDEVTYDPVLEVFSVHFDVPAEDATAWNFYNGTLTITLENETIGTTVIKEVPTQIVQGAIDYNESEYWFSEFELEAPTNYVPETEMPERTKAIVETMFTFENPSPETDDPPEGEAQAAVRIVEDGAGGYKFQYYAFAGKADGYYYRAWHDFNVGGENAREIKPMVGHSYIVRMEGFYQEDARGEANTLAVSVKDEADNRDPNPVPQFVGNLINKDGGIGGTTRLNSVEFVGEGTVESLYGNYCVNIINANLARIDDDEYATVADAVDAAGGKPVRLLHAASWKPTAADFGKSVKILNKSWLHLDLSDLPFGMRPVWSGVDGNNGTMTLTQLYGELKRVAPYLHEIWYEGYVDSPLTGEDAPFGDLQVQGMGGCSSVRVGNFHGRNLDIGISDLASIVVHVAASSNRFASVGTTQWSDVSETSLSTNGASAHRFDVLPSWMLDGINENGVAINVNVVPLDVPQEGADPESDARPPMHARKVVRYVLDNAASAADAVEKLQGFRVYGNIGTGTFYLHWMISDPTTTYVVEIINGEVVAREHPIMTNFNLNWDNENKCAISDPENWGPETYFNPADYAEDPDRILTRYTQHADGIERYLMLRDAPYAEMGGTLEGMFDLLKIVRYTRIAYLPLEDTYRSDFVEIEDANAAGFNLLTDIYAASNTAKLAALWSTLQPAMTNVFEHLADYRKPDEIGEYSITTHNVTFDLGNRMFRIAVQEDYEHVFDFWLVEPVGVTLPTGGQGFSYVVSNLTAGSEVKAKGEVGGATYELPIGARVGIYCVPAAGYVVTGTNPYVIEKVTAETTLEGVTLPTAVEPVPADTVVYGTIRTAEEGNPVAEAIAIKGGKYVYVGDEAGAAAFVEAGVTKVVDHRGKGMVMPGCTDGHSHYLNTFAMNNMKGGVLFDLSDGKAEVLQKLKDAALAAQTAEKTSLCGFGWNSQTILTNKLSLADLDGVTHGVSTVIYDSSGHHAFCNSECLKRCGIIDGKGGVLITEIDGGLLELEDGYPTGYVNERVTGYLTRMGGIDADELIDDKVAEDAIRASQELLLSTGYTTAMDAWSNNLHPSNFYVVAKRMDANGDLKFALSMTYEVEPWQTDEAISNEIKRLDSLRTTYGTEHVRPEYLKVFMDGVVEARTGATIKPYMKDDKHPEEYYYQSFWSVDRLAEITKACNDMGLTVHTHTMGDAAIRDVTDAYAKANALRDENTYRNCLVHLRNVRKEDFQRMVENNIACAVGLTWHAMDTDFEDILKQFLDDEYVEHSYPIKSFLDAGVRASSHSDYPANKPSPQDPFGMMHVAVNGMVPDPGEKDYPYDTNELITVEEAFQVLTLNGAWQLGLENERGSIQVGKWADFVLADQDVFTCEKTDIGKTKVVSTWFEGERVFEAAESVPVTPGVPIVCDTAEEASNVLKKAEFTPSAEVAERLGGEGSTALQTYRNMFTLDVVPTSDDKWAVEAFLLPPDWTNVVESAQAATRQIPLADIAALPLGVPTNVTAKGCCVPGFYYSFYAGSTVTNVRAIVDDLGRNVLCGPDRDVKFSGVLKPSDKAGFFSIGVLEVPKVYEAGTDYPITGFVPVIPGHPRPRVN